MSWVGHMTHMRTGFWGEPLRKRCNFENLDLDTGIVLKQILKKSFART
jgi:hypothetical protein